MGICICLWVCLVCLHVGILQVVVFICFFVFLVCLQVIGAIHFPSCVGWLLVGGCLVVCWIAGVVVCSLVFLICSRALLSFPMLGGCLHLVVLCCVDCFGGCLCSLPFRCGVGRGMLLVLWGGAGGGGWRCSFLLIGLGGDWGIGLCFHHHFTHTAAPSQRHCAVAESSGCAACGLPHQC